MIIPLRLPQAHSIFVRYGGEIMTPGPQLTCETCGKRFTRNQGTSRLNCYQCRPSRAKGSNVAQFPQVSAEEAEGEEDQGPTLVDYTRDALEKAGVLETWQGASAMELAKLIVAGKHGASGAAGTIKALREAMAVALADSGEDADVIDLIFAEGS